MFYGDSGTWRRVLERHPAEEISALQVRRSLAKGSLEAEDLWILLSPAAGRFLEEMACRARSLTLRHFGRSVSLFVPLYLANYCTNQCVYCSFNTHNRIPRKRLSPAQAAAEGEAIAKTGIQHLLLLTGESRTMSGPDYLQACVRQLRPHFASLGIEVYPLAEEEYRELILSGVDSLTMFQEVYDERLYAEMHPGGPKADYHYRLNAPERACRAGMAEVTLGALLGLGDWRREAFMTAWHGSYLQRHYPEVQVSFSLPRMRPHVGEFQPPSPVSDRSLVQILLAYRLFLPRAGITISTREKASLRDALVPLGITRMSAGSLTSVGGYTGSPNPESAQFEIADERSAAEIIAMLHRQGYQPVLCDWLNMRQGAGELQKEGCSPC
ncbi:2-iminoacetate synthase [Peptococcaceae bacterium CEB3]|nr:2-iminoacetate synthase [Peptococcaceae bacterium CEB3]